MDKKPPKRENMIQVKIWLFVDDLPLKHAWEAGRVGLPANRKHGIRAGRNKPFHSFEEIQALIKDALMEGGVTVRYGNPRLENRKLRKRVSN